MVNVQVYVSLDTLKRKLFVRRCSLWHEQTKLLKEYAELEIALAVLDRYKSE